MDDFLFAVEDPNGRKVKLYSSQFNNHIIVESGHNEVRSEEIRETIVEPQVIYRSSTHDNRNVYFSKKSASYPALYVKVATEKVEEAEEWNVITAFLSKRVAGGIDEGEGGLLYVDRSNKL